MLVLRCVRRSVSGCSSPLYAASVSCSVAPRNAVDSFPQPRTWKAYFASKPPTGGGHTDLSEEQQIAADILEQKAAPSRFLTSAFEGVDPLEEEYDLEVQQRDKEDYQELRSEILRRLKAHKLKQLGDDYDETTDEKLDDRELGMDEIMLPDEEFEPMDPEIIGNQIRQLDMAAQPTPLPTFEEKKEAARLDERIKIRHLIKTGLHTKITKSGRVQSHSCLLILGTGTGTAGIGYGKGPTLGKATERAERDAQKNFVSVELYERRTLPHSVKVQYRRSTLIMLNKPRDFGIKAHRDLYALCEAFGVKDISIKTAGSRNPHNMLRACIKGLLMGRSARHIADATGRALFNKYRVWTPGQGDPLASDIYNEL